MFQKIRFRLTFLCAAITICFLCLFTGLYLYIAEKTLTENHYLAFQHDMDSLSASLEQQTSITIQYLLKMEQSGNYMIFLWDEEIPFYFNDMPHHKPYKDLALRLWDEYIKTGDLLSDKEQSPVTHVEFLYEDTDNTEYNVSAARILTGQMSSAQSLALKGTQAGITFLVLSPRTGFLQQLSTQRLWFLLLSAGGCVLLTFFAWFFTGRLLRPIQENQRRQTQFVSYASHELRAPLAVIRSCISIRPPHYEDTILQESIRMGRLVDDMLSLSGLESKTHHFHMEAVQPDTFLLNLYEQTEPLALEKEIRLAVSLPEDALPLCIADPDRLQQLFMILIQNALCYTPCRGQITLKVSFTPARGIAFQVIDTGIGIADEDKKHIFERFYRVDTSHSDKNHFGLGLCIAQEIMYAHQGQISVTDTPEGGSTFTCLFPQYTNRS